MLSLFKVILLWHLENRKFAREWNRHTGALTTVSFKTEWTFSMIYLSKMDCNILLSRQDNFLTILCYRWRGLDWFILYELINVKFCVKDVAFEWDNYHVIMVLFITFLTRFNLSEMSLKWLNPLKNITILLKKWCITQTLLYSGA